MSIIVFNGGMEYGLSCLLKDIGTVLGPRPINFFLEADKMRVSKSDRSAKEVTKSIMSFLTTTSVEEKI